MSPGFSEHHVLRTHSRLNSIYALCVILISALAAAYFLVETRKYGEERTGELLAGLIADERVLLFRSARAVHDLATRPSPEWRDSRSLADLKEALNGLRSVHPQLKAGTAAGRLPFRRARAVLFEGPFELDRRMQRFLFNGERLVASAMNGNAPEMMRAVEEISDRDMDLLSEALRELHTRVMAEITAEARQSHKVVVVVVLSILIILVVLSLVVFRPLSTALRQQVRRLGRQKEKALAAVRLARRAKDEADRANQAKTTFVANVSHDLRTPLNAILGFSGMLTFSRLDDGERVEYASAIQRNGRQLLQLVDDLLDLSRMEVGEVRLTTQPVRLMPLVTEVIHLFEAEARSRGVDLELVAPVTASNDVIVTDSTRLKQILVNLVGNAVKFTEKGIVGLEVRIVDQQGYESRRSVICRVRDTGPGIPRNQWYRLFEPFERLDCPASRRKAGSGLGLAISRRLARALGGDVVLTFSEPGQGSVFELTVDGGRSEDCAGARLDTESTGPNLLPVPSLAPGVKGRPRVLLVEDSEDNQILFTRFLELAGIQVEVIDNGISAIEVGSRGEFDLILLDIQIPGKNGYEVVTELRRRGVRQPILALTAFAMDGERQRCFDAGFDGFLTKPIERRYFVERISSYLRSEFTFESTAQR